MHKSFVILSDTHGYLDPGLEEYVSAADEVWHAGDVGSLAVIDQLTSWNAQLKWVYGNIDGGALRQDGQEYIVEDFGDHRILMIHIAGPLGRYHPRVRELIREYRPTLLICGHSHICKVQKDPKFSLLYMNPGACGNHGFHKVRTLLKFSLSPGKMERLEVVELGKRGKLG